MKQIIPAILISMCIHLPAAFADSKPDFPADSRIKIFTYAPSDVYTILTKYGYQTSVSFAANEEINTISVGERSMWQIIPTGNRIFIRPMDDGLTTNMTVITNMREYTFDIKSVEENSSNNLYVIQFRYPDGRAANADDKIPPPAPVMPAMAPRASNVAIPPLDTQRDQTTNEQYSYTGSDAVAPARVYDDGKYTYIEYNAMLSPPPVPYVVGPSGQPAIAAHETRGNRMILATVASGFVLKSDSGDITVYNELFHN